jgi:hypothetical protein
MNSIRLFTDEDMPGALAGQLRAAGWDALSTPEANRLGERDPDSWPGLPRKVVFW